MQCRRTGLRSKTYSLRDFSLRALYSGLCDKRNQTATASYMRTWPGWFGLWVLYVAVVFTDVFVGWYWYLHCSISNVFLADSTPPIEQRGGIGKSPTLRVHSQVQQHACINIIKDNNNGHRIYRNDSVSLDCKK